MGYFSFSGQGKKCTELQKKHASALLWFKRTTPQIRGGRLGLEPARELPGDHDSSSLASFFPSSSSCDRRNTHTHSGQCPESWSQPGYLLGGHRRRPRPACAPGRTPAPVCFAGFYPKHISVISRDSTAVVMLTPAVSPGGIWVAGPSQRPLQPR